MEAEFAAEEEYEASAQLFGSYSMYERGQEDYGICSVDDDGSTAYRLEADQVISGVAT